MGGAMLNPILLVPFLLFLSLSSSASDTLTPSQSLAGNQTLISADQKFELGFFSNGGGNKIYLGIWYFNLPVKTLVWVANRDSPARSSSFSLKLATSGQISISDQSGSGVVWSSNHSAANPVLQLLDSGNLVVRESADSGNYIWQSFDYPTDTLLPGQKLGWDKNTGLDRYLTSWRSTSDPSSGLYSVRLDRAGDPEIYLLKGGNQRIYRSGPWVGLRFSGVPDMKPTPALNFTFQDTASEAYYMFSLVDRSIKSRLMVDPTGSLKRFMSVADRAQWNLAPKDQCDDYMECGANGVCDAGNLFVCGCPDGFVPSKPVAWEMKDGSDGCVRRTRLECGSDGFMVLRDMKLPESGAAVVDNGKGLEECEAECRRDCNCTAYANRQVEYGVGSRCVMWNSDLKDLRTYDEGGQYLYIRLAAADLGKNSPIYGARKTRPKVKVIVGIAIPVTSAAIMLTVAMYFLFTKKSTGKKSDVVTDSEDFTTAESLQYDLKVLQTATNNFSVANKLGEGGFGGVYWGKLTNGQEIAVKRLSQRSSQGASEFKNEVVLVAKLQHRNLVRLLGFCLAGDEKLLVYEFVPNKSLDHFLFAEEHAKLDWTRRYKIIRGIARGLLYLHEDSRLRIIHRDIKPSNILLDTDMTPKISDFGLAKILGLDQAQGNTNRIAGTYGYMPPEYAFKGEYSESLDVYGFGVMVLEIISGQKVNSFRQSEYPYHLMSYAWKKWKDNEPLEIMEPNLRGGTDSKEEVIRCIHLGLLCVQDDVAARPSMSMVVMTLSCHDVFLPQPRNPAFNSCSKDNKPVYSSINLVSITGVGPR